jgi:succinate dehydrogenase / fumarate reductase iron-sulfur subunit
LHSLRFVLFSLPVLKENENFLGPAAIAQAYRFNADTRDRGVDERLPVLDHPNGVWPCQNHFKCTRSCPRGILITKRINQTKRMIEKSKTEDAGK